MIDKKEMKEEDERINNQTATCSRSSSSSSSDERDYEVQDLRDKLKSSRGSRFNLIEKELGWRKFSRQTLLHEFVINPHNRLVLLLYFI
jgi:potassium channel